MTIGPTLRTATAGLLLLLCGAAPGLGRMNGGMHGPRGMGMGMPQAVMAGVVGPELMVACHADLTALGLSAETREALEAKRFELRKRVIRALAELSVLRLELDRLTGSRGFDLEQARAKTGEVAGVENELRVAHLEFLHALGAVLTDEQWKNLDAAPPAAPPMGMPCPPCRAMSGPGAGMPPEMGGMMHRHRHGGGSETTGEAERFFGDD